MATTCRGVCGSMPSAPRWAARECSMRRERWRASRASRGGTSPWSTATRRTPTTTLPPRARRTTSSRGSCRSWRGSARGRDAEDGRLDVPEAVDVAADAGDRVVEEEGLGEAHDRVGERGGLDGRFVVSGSFLLLDHLCDSRHHHLLRPACARGNDPQGGVALLLDELAQSGGLDQTAVEPVEGVEQRLPAASGCLR